MTEHWVRREKSHNWTEAELDLVRRRWAEGESATKIAAELGQGLSKNAIISRVHAMKLPPHKLVTLKAPAEPKPPREKIIRTAKARAKEIKVPRADADLPPLRQAPFRPGKIETVDDSEIIGIPFLEVSDKTCRWPIWGLEPISYEQKRCCGASVRDGSVYCEQHHIRGLNPQAR